jgi:hypothetical protein
MEPHSELGTHRLELPVSRTTLKVCGGVPMVISEKSGDGELAIGREQRVDDVDWRSTYIARS